MNGRRSLPLLLVMAIWQLHVRAQTLPFMTGYIEDLLYRYESALLPEMQEIAEEGMSLTPLDLNNASSDELEASGMFSAFQIHQILNYRERFGSLYSIHELAALPGFTTAFLSGIDSLVRTGTGAGREERSGARYMGMVNLERKYPAIERDGFAGSPLKASGRILSSPGKNIKIALSYEKDAGEAFLYRRRPQFLSGYLSARWQHFIKEVVVGNYQLNLGLGLVHGTGFFHGPGGLRINRQSISRIKPYASLTESRYEQGMACRMGTEHIQILIWGSYLHFSLSQNAISGQLGPDQWLRYQGSSGLFRTSGELEGRDLAHRTHTGIQLLYVNRGLGIGIQSGREWVGPTGKASGLLGNIPVPWVQQSLGLHGNWQRNRIQVFGELAVSKFQSMAIQLGTCYQFNDFIMGSMLLHHYGPDYRGFMPSGFSSGSHIRNEQGLVFHLKMESGKSVIILLTGELFHYPRPRYLTEVPSIGYRMDLTFQSTMESCIQWRARLNSKTWQTTAGSEQAPMGPLMNSSVHRLDGQLVYKPDEHFRWLSRLVAGYCVHRQQPSTAYALLQQLSYSHGPVKVVAQCVLFQAEEWANRIYVYEPGFYYSFNFPVLYGCGQRTSLLLTCKPTRGLTVSAKISGINNRGEKHWESGMQLRINL